MHPWHEARGAPLECAGDWLRPWYFPLPGEDREKAVQRECVAVRARVGVADASPLGKIDLRGPDAAAVLERLTDMDLSREAFPFMSMREGQVAGVPARIFRISFTGELSFEINVPARYGMHLWEALMEAGGGFGIVAYGTDAMHVLRAEKGFIVVGQDTDGTVTPADLGMDRMVSGNKGDFLGRRSLSRPAIAAPGRRQLVGILTTDPDHVLAQGIHLTRERDVTLPARTEGFVSSTYRSPNLGRSIALGLVVDGRARHGESLFAQGLDGTAVPVRLTDSVFIDRERARA